MSDSNFKIKNGARLVPEASPTLNEQGELKFDSVSDKLQVRRSASTDSILMEVATQTLTNKSIDADQNTITNIENADIKAAANIALSKLAALAVSRALVSDGSGVISASSVTATEVGQLSGITSAVVGISDTQTLTNKIIDGDSNTLQDVALSSLKTVLGDANKFLVRDGSGIVVSNTKDVPTGAVVGTSDSQTLTNKTLTSPTMTDPYVSSGPIRIVEQATPATPASGSVVIYPKSDGNVYKKTSSGIESQIGSGGGGGAKNYLGTVNNINGNGDFELGATTKWSLFNTTLTSKIPTGSITAGAASVTTFDTVSSAQLAGSYSLRTASSGVWSAGQGFISDAFTIDKEDQAKVLTISAYYNVFSGASNGVFAGSSSNTFAVYVYAVNGTAGWIQPAGVYSINQSSGVGLFSATFQTNSDSTQYRLAIICITASAGAISMYWDDFKVSPQTIVYGAPVTDLIYSYVPTLVGDGTAGVVTYTSNTIVKYARVGDMLQGSAYIELGTVTTSPTGTYLQLSLPPGITIDTAKASISTFYLGSGTFQDFSVGVYPITVNNVGSGAYLRIQKADGSAWPTFAAVDNFRLDFSFPVTGWSSTVQMSNDTDTRVVAARIGTSGAPTGTIASSYGSSTTIQYNSVTHDTHSAYVAATGYTIPVSGYYRIYARQYISHASVSVGNEISLGILKNGVVQSVSTIVVSSASVLFYFPQVQDLRFFNAGDIITVRGTSNGSTPVTASDSTGNMLSVERLSGPSAIAASEKVVVRAQLSVSETGINDKVIPFNAKRIDTHGTFDITTNKGRFTAPRAGYYKIYSGIMAENIDQADNVSLYILKNGSETAESFGSLLKAAATAVSFAVSDIVQMNAGDYLEVYINGDSNGFDITGNSSRNYVHIESV
jgi:hypothetical protein